MIRIALKIAAVVALTIGLLIPLAMIRGVIQERSHFRHQARSDIASSWTGAQQLFGPVLSVPYTLYGWEKPLDPKTGKPTGEDPVRVVKRQTRHLIPPRELRIKSELGTETRRRGLYEVPVYSTKMLLEGTLDTSSLAEIEPGDLEIEFGEPELVVSVSDNRGIASQPEVVWNQRPLEVNSGSGLPGIPSGVRSPTGEIDLEGGLYAFHIALDLRGMERIAFSPVGDDTRVDLTATWPHPSFTGDFLPSEYEVHESGFTASWQVSHFATDTAQVLERLLAPEGDHAGQVRGRCFGVSLINPVDIYQQATRSAKYGVLFIVLTFTAFWLIEFLRKLQLHPVQYLLVGLSLTIFFLLLLSLSEHMPFGAAYGISMAACVGLIGFYMSASLGSLANSGGVVAALSGLYGMLYAILMSEDNALLMGTLLLFAALAAVMLATRKIDWYALSRQLAETRKPSPPLGGPGDSTGHVSPS
ncbi:hypothetical protein ABI59_16625 [Acidobacteria bacterium Mor1]|nr:hypothetical protein ABI59_16625 [Acidobacteria bacterium Mor1]